LHCVHYRECLDRAVKEGCQLKCHNCEKFEFFQDHYQKEINLSGINKQIPGEQSVKIEVFECQPAPDNNQKRKLKRKKIMENHKSESEKVGELEGKKPDRIDALIDTICMEEGIDRKFLHSRTYSKKKLKPLRLKLAGALKDKGLKNTEIAKKIGCAESSLYNYMKDTDSNKKKKENVKPDSAPASKSENKNTLVIDFSKHPDTLKRIKKIAVDKLRKPENQVLYWLKEFSLILEKEESNEQHH